MSIYDFYIALMVLVVAIMSLLLFRYHRRITQLKAEKETAEKATEICEAKLGQTNRLRSNFFANISHELRTPLTLIQGGAEAILRTDKLPTQTKESAKTIKNNVRQMTVMVNDLLELSRVGDNVSQFRLRPVYIAPIVSRIVGVFTALSESTSIELRYYPDIPASVAVDLDESQFEKGVNNLLRNSFKLASEKGKVEVYSAVEGSDVLLKVITNGTGVPSGDLAHIFDWFYQPDIPESRGGGLGLIVAKELIEQMKGEVTVTSHSDGGLLLQIRLPVSSLVPSLEDELIGIEEVKSHKSVSDFLDLFEVPSNIAVLVVEDNKLLQAYLKDILRDHFELVVAENGQEALDHLERFTPDLILTDVMMPVMDGWQLIERIRENMALSKIPVIVLTAVAENSDRLKGLRLGVDDYILKPFEIEELLIRISNVVGNLRERIRWAKEFEPEEKQDLSEERDLVLEVRSFVKQNIGDRKLSVTQLATHLGLSERQMYRKTAQAVGLSPSKLITEIRLQHARELLVSNRYEKLAQIASEIGFESSAYFSKLYHERFGKKPTDYFS